MPTLYEFLVALENLETELLTTDGAFVQETLKALMDLVPPEDLSHEDIILMDVLVQMASDQLKLPCAA